MNTRCLRWYAGAAVALTLACRSGAQGPPEWSRPTEPFRIIGNVHWVGTHDLSSYLITSPEGHIVINTGLADSVSQIRANIERLGFRVSDVKILTATHAHSDHVAGLAALKKMTGARVCMSAPDADVLESGGKSRWGKDPRVWFDPVAVDRRLKDGETIRLGANSLVLHIHAGQARRCLHCRAVRGSQGVPRGGGRVGGDLSKAAGGGAAAAVSDLIAPRQAP